MTYALIATAAPSTGFNVTLTPAMPAGFVAGNLLLLCTGSYQGSLATPTVAGWTKLSPGVNANQIAIYGKIAVGADASPSVTWGNQNAFAFVTAYSGNSSNLATIVHASVDGKTTSPINTAFVTYSALTITQPNCLVIAFGSRDKTTNSDGGSFASIANFGIRNTSTLNGAAFAAVMNDWVQTSATNAPSVTQYFSKNDTTVQQYESIVLALLPQSSGYTYTLTASTFSVAVTGNAANLSAGKGNFTLIANPGYVSVAFAVSTSDFSLTAANFSVASTLRPATLTLGSLLTSPWIGPDNLTISTTTQTTALASWSAAADIAVTGYKLRLTTGGVPTVIDVHNTTYFTLTGLTPATSYFLEIAAYDAAGDISAYAAGTATFLTLSTSAGVSKMTSQYVFGPGVAWITPLTDSTGAAIANPSPILVAAMQDVNLDLSAEVKQLYGTNSYAVAIGRGKQKLAVKIKNGQVHGRLWNSIFFGQTLAAGIYDAYYDTTGTAIPTTPFTITPTPPSSGTFGYDLGVRDVNNIPYSRVASAPTTGQYSVAGGVYTFAAADTTKVVYISYNYTATSTVAQKLSIANQPMGYAPTFQFDLKIPYQGNVFNATLFNCMATKAALATKLDDFAYPEFDFDAFAPGSATVGELSWSN